ncbi:hypothetical protein G6F64_009871 [Rhizopus arrhizus]|uniref:DUF676 domain-containing protein n=1 Tax=Rhizopus oryzae TaxID=64495 RepID=A0A9P7BNX9_RHIOR|nr:hypothetical protein G6F64_009871 [Rhizopus arrhizus]
MTDKGPVSLVVLSHGLWGVKTHMNYIKKKLLEKYKRSIIVLNIDVNEAKYTYDGIDICGERAAQQIEGTLRQLEKMNRKVEKISMIGYSLGGLILRYAIGILGKRGIFDQIKPEYFITFATPHLGVRLPDNNLISRIFNFFSGKFVSHSGEQLQLRDDKSLLQLLSDPGEDYFKYLARFKVRRSYANIANDRTVPYWTAGIESMDYFYKSKGKLDITLDEKYTSIITGFDLKLDNSKKTKKKGGIKWKMAVLYLLLPILGPLFLLFGMIVIIFQGLLSRYRVSRHLSSQPLLKDDEEQFMKGDILAGALDIINLSPDDDDDTPNIVSLNTSGDTYSHAEPSAALKEKSKPLPLNETARRIHDNLTLLEWERVWVYLNVFNAHGTIVCRQHIHTTQEGEATIQHFLNTTQFQ